MNIVAMIPARGGSKRIQRKNIKSLAGKPLLAHTIESARKVERINRVIVSTEDADIMKVAKEFGAEVVTRPADLATDEAKTEPALFHAVECIESDSFQVDLVVLLQPTSPLRDAEQINLALDQFFREKADSLVSVSEEYKFIWGADGPLNYSLQDYRQRPPLRPGAMEPLLVENGAIYIATRKVLMEGQNRLGGKISIFVSPPDTDIDIDLPRDWQEAEKRMAHRTYIEPGRCFVVAEIGCNHMGDIDVAKRMIDIAHYCRVDAVKGQKRHIPELLTEDEYNRPYEGPHSFGATYGEHREVLEFDIEEHKELADYAARLGMLYFLSVWDVTSAREALDNIPSPMVKVPSAKLTNHAMLEVIRESGKTVLLSTGMSTFDEIDIAVESLKGGGSLYLLQCTSAYPVQFEDINLRAMTALKERYGDRLAGVGFSGHNLGVAIDIGAVALGAQIVERHFTLDRTWKGVDHAASLEPTGLKKLVRDIRAFEKSLGEPDKKVLPCEMEARKKLRGNDK